MPPRSPSPKIVTASDLLIGDVVYLTAEDTWSRRMEDAEVITDEAHAQLRLLHAERQASIVLDAYLADVTPAETGPEPRHFREAFRRRGPSNYTHGKQEDARHV